MVIFGVIFGSVHGSVLIGKVGSSAIDSSKDAIELCITMLAVVGMWNGIMNIAKESGLISKWTKAINPAINFLYPNIPKSCVAREYIATNMISNMLGLGWAATPAGLKAMDALATINPLQSKGVASNEMCTFLVMNISSLQLIPINMIAYRNQYNSVSAAAIIGPALLATLISSLAAVIFCKCACKLKRKI